MEFYACFYKCPAWVFLAGYCDSGLAKDILPGELDVPSVTSVLLVIVTLLPA